MLKKMLKKLLIFVLFTLFVSVTVTTVAAAAGGGGVSLYLTDIAVCPGDSVTALGVVPDHNCWVSVKLLESTGGIVFFEGTKSDSRGYYSLTFRVPSGEAGIWTVVAGYGTNVANGNLNVTSKPENKNNIKSIGQLADIEVAFATAQEKINLPASVEVALDDGSKESVGVFWNSVTPAYDGSKAKEYTFTGTLVNLKNITNTLNLKASVKVIVKPGETSPAGPGVPVPSTPTGGTEVQIDDGGKVSEDHAVVEIPAGAFTRDLKVKIAAVTDISGLPLPENSRLASAVLEITKDEKGDFIKPVTITMVFDKSKVDSKDEIALYYFDTPGGVWVKLDNIKVDREKGTVSGEIDHFTKFAVIASSKEKPPLVPVPPVFTDVRGHWAEANIKTLVEKGAIAGYPDRTFKPDNNITRAEFVTVLVKAFQLEAKEGSGVFADVVTHWAKEAIVTAGTCGIVKGYSDENFGPDDPITREQMAVMIVKAAGLTGAAGMNTAFSDNNKIAGWAQPAVATASASVIITGYPEDGTFRPQDRATRAEAATVVVKALK